MKHPTVSVVIPARNSEATIGDTLRSLLTQTLPPEEILVVGAPDDTTYTAVVPFLENSTVRYIEAAAPAGYVRDAQYKRRVGAREARGEWIFFTDSKVLLDAGALEAALGAAGRASVDAVAGTARSCPDDAHKLMALLQDEALVQNNPRFGASRLLTRENFGSAEDLPVTTALLLSRPAFEAIEHDFGVAHSRYGTSYEDYAVAWLLVSHDFPILCTDTVVSYHKHRLTWKGYARQIARSGQGAALFTARYPDCPFAERRTGQVELWLGAHLGALLAFVLGVAFAGLAAVGALLALSLVAFTILGGVQAVVRRNVRTALLPPLTYVLIWIFVYHYMYWALMPQRTYMRRAAAYVQLD